MTIKIYPSNWLYNAAVIGFLKILAVGGEKVASMFKDDGTVEIPLEVFNEVNYSSEVSLSKSIEYLINLIVSNEELKNWKQEKDKRGIKNEDKYREFYIKFGEKEIGYKFIRAGNKLFASQTPYQNLVQFSEWQNFEFLKLISGLKNYPSISSSIACSICGEKKIQTPQENSKLEKRLFNFQEPHNRLLAPSTGKFPNALWHMRTSLTICLFCAYLLIHHHIPFESAQTQNGQIFINAPSFKVMWHLNSFAENILSKNTGYKIQKILGISFMEFAQRVSVTLGAWSIMYIEMIIRRGDKIEYYSLPCEVTRVLLQKEIASLISETKEPYILEIVLNGEFDHLLILTHKILKYAITGSNAFDDKYLSQLRNRDSFRLRTLSKILPELYVRINSLIKGEVIL